MVQRKKLLRMLEELRKNPHLYIAYGKLGKACGGMDARTVRSNVELLSELGVLHFEEWLKK